ncbi:hypothetical protein GLW04_00430 [Halobacillus litoralis]|uniref:Uncharacterized protein n=1 Tax=Halobacillus litoralis TaxID=45668 RepID=A0A845DPM9_9BACI|nr:hypothetical protein [Halobacillus litoralis]MYL30661.1 hypothetical protein [Halobacillus halophilus]MYL38678.1 hypothetical protein [Halobacillus litoralis]
MICAHPIIVKTRTIRNNQQVYEEREERLELYEDSVVCPDEILERKDVHDVSYKAFSQGSGFLYLHTIKGVRTFLVKEHPGAWMDAFRTNA